MIPRADATCMFPLVVVEEVQEGAELDRSRSIAQMQRSTTPRLIYPLSDSDLEENTELIEDSSPTTSSALSSQPEPQSTSCHLLISTNESTMLQQIVRRLLLQIMSAHQHCAHDWGTATLRTTEAMLSELRQQWEIIRTVIARDQQRWSNAVDLSMFPQYLRAQTSRDATDKLQQTLEWSSPAAFMPPNSDEPRNASPLPLQPINVNDTTMLTVSRKRNRQYDASLPSSVTQRSKHSVATTDIMRCCASSRAVEGASALVAALLIAV